MRFAATDRVEVRISSRLAEGEETVLGCVDSGVFVVVPTEAVAILDELAGGRSVGEVQEALRGEDGEAPDLDEFLAHLEARGLVRRTAPAAAPASGPLPRFHLSDFPEAWARRLVGRASVGTGLAVVAAALLALAIDPGILPDPRRIDLSGHLTAAILLLTSLYWGSLLLHELAHLVAARAVGVPSRLQVGHRLWVLVAETDMSGLWSVPRRRRYLPLLAGPLVDAVSAAVLIGGSFGVRHGWWPMARWPQAMLAALLLNYLASLLWQCCLFVRTDFYYVLSNALGCRNLLSDTEAYLRAQLGRLLTFLPRRELPRLPARELRVVKVYTLAWILGRILALAVLALVYLPFFLHFGGVVVRGLAAGYRSGRNGFVDALLTLFLVLGPLLAGTFLWLRDLILSGRVRAAAAGAPISRAV